MSRTNFIEYHGNGFWVYDVAKGVFLKFLIDCAEEYRKSAVDDCAWLGEAIRHWRVEACISDIGMTIEGTWSETQVGVFLKLADEVCARLELRELIPAQEAEGWNILDGEQFFVRGATDIQTKVIAQLGRAIIALVKGAMPPPPAHTWWFFGSPDKDERLLKKAGYWEAVGASAKPEGNNIDVMVLRLSKQFARKLDVKPTQVLPMAPNPLADWSCHLFTANGRKHWILTNTASLCSTIIYSVKCEPDNSDFYLFWLLASIVGFVDDFRIELDRQPIVFPEREGVQFSLAINHATTESINDLVSHAKMLLSENEVSAFDASVSLNDHPFPFLSLKDRTPREALKELMLQNLLQAPPKPSVDLSWLDKSK